MKHRMAILPALTSFAAGCGAGTPAPPPDPRSELIASLGKLTAGCGLPARTLTLHGADQVAVQVQADVDYEKVDCLLTALRETHPKLKLGFIGNEAYHTENEI